MGVRPLTDDDHVVRHCPQRHLIIENGEVLGVFADAFSLRPAKGDRPAETYLSTTWLEFFGSVPRREQLRQTAACLRAAGREVKGSHGLAVCSVRAIIAAGAQRSSKLRVLYEPIAENPAYSAIRGLPPDNRDIELLELLARDACAEVATIRQVELAD